MKQVSFKLAVACGVWLAGVAVMRSQPLTIRTLAGNGTAGATNGYGSNARFNHPLGAAADAAGNVYLADTENGTIRKIAPDGFGSSLAGLAGHFGSGSGSGTNARFFGPQGIASDDAGNLIVADTANAIIRKITPGGTVSTLAGLPGTFNSYDGTGANARFYQPEGVALDNGGNVYVADAWNHTIRKITPAGVVTTLAGLAGSPGGMDGANSKARFNRPCGIAVDAATNLFVTDSLNHTIRMITPGGWVSTVAGLAGVWGNADGTNSSARFFQPHGIAVVGTNLIFVIDSGNQSIRQLSASGTNWVASAVAGLTGISGKANGTGDVAQFSFPAGIALDNEGFLYVADSGNHLIRTTRVVPPTLLALTTPSKLSLSWPVSAEGFALESSSAVGFGSTWMPVTNGVFISGDNFTLTNTTQTAAAYYRLHKP